MNVATTTLIPMCAHSSWLTVTVLAEVEGAGPGPNQ
jgi:hypothetical protein